MASKEQSNNNSFEKYLFIIYSCKKNLDKAENLYYFLMSKNFHKLCKILIIYGDISRVEFQNTNKNYIFIFSYTNLRNLFNKAKFIKKKNAILKKSILLKKISFSISNSF